MAKLIPSVVLIAAIAAMGAYSTQPEAAPPDKCSPWPECKDGGSEPPPPPADCANFFPAIAYRSSGVISIANLDGCQIGTVISTGGGVAQLHVYEDAATASTDGAVYWAEQDNGTYVYRAGFEIDADGNLVPGAATQLLPDLVEDDLASGEIVYFFSGETDVWGDPASSRGFLTTVRHKTLAIDGTILSSDWVIYEFDDAGISDSRVLLSSAYDIASIASLTENDCATNLAHPHQVPACYKLDAGTDITWHPSGSRIYFEAKQGETDLSELWLSTMRMDIENRDINGQFLPLDQWAFSEPEMVYIGTFRIGQELDALYREPSGAEVRPPANSSDPEYIGVKYFDHSGRHTELRNVILNADACVDTYAPYSDGFTGPVDYALWMQCAATSEFSLDHMTGRFDRVGTVWDSPYSILDTGAVGNRNSKSSNIYRRTVSGGTAGTSLLIIEGGSLPNTGN